MLSLLLLHREAVELWPRPPVEVKVVRVPAIRWRQTSRRRWPWVEIHDGFDVDEDLVAEGLLLAQVRWHRRPAGEEVAWSLVLGDTQPADKRDV
jgi:hypothetical protein